MRNPESGQKPKTKRAQPLRSDIGGGQGRRAVSGPPYLDETLTLFFDLYRARDTLGGQFTQLLLRFGIPDSVGVPPQIVGLISQIDRARRHREILIWESP